MSLYLGKIHFWLYNKILLYEDLEREIIRHLKGKDDPYIDGLVESINNRFGIPAERKPLEAVVDESNIHGWLQSRIENAELRQAALITGLLKKDPEYIGVLEELYEKQGKTAASSYGGNASTPEEIFIAIQDFILDGMPCDRVNEVVTITGDEYAWRAVSCLHQPYWDSVGGDVRNFYRLRDAWNTAFVKTINNAFRYVKIEEGIKIIARQQ